MENFYINFIILNLSVEVKLVHITYGALKLVYVSYVTFPVEKVLTKVCDIAE